MVRALERCASPRSDKKHINGDGNAVGGVCLPSIEEDRKYGAE